MKNTIIVMMVAFGFLFAGDFEYVGTKKCKTCHKSDKKGAQYKVWEVSAHANAFEVLNSEEAAKIAKEKGIKGEAFEAAECLICHSTGFGKGGYEVKDADFWDLKTEKGKPTKEVKRMTALQAVGCEACHGPGSGYKSKKKMEGVFTGTIEADSVGLVHPDEEVCKTCHNADSPTFKSFDFKEQMKKIAHPYPEEMKK